MPPEHHQQLSDPALWDLCRSGNLQAFSTLYDRLWQPLYETAWWRLRDEDAAKDIVQETFIHCWQQRQTLLITSSVKAYFQSAIRRRVLNHLQSAAAREKYTRLSGEQLPLLHHDTSETVEVRELEALYRQQLAQLPPAMRDVFTDSREHGLSVAEIAEKRQLSPQTVKNQLSGALKKMREGLGNWAKFFF